MFNLRTVIVTAAVYRGFGRQLRLRSPPPSTYRHRAGVRRYTSSCEFAASCVFDKQSLEPILCGSPCGEHPLSRSYGVNLPSSFTRVLPNAFGYSPRSPVSDYGTGRCVVPAGLFVAMCQRGFQNNAVGLAARGHLAPRPLIARRPLQFNLHNGCRNINLLSIDYAFQPRLRSRLTLGGLTFPRKP